MPARKPSPKQIKSSRFAGHGANPQQVVRKPLEISPEFKHDVELASVNARITQLFRQLNDLDLRTRRDLDNTPPGSGHLNHGATTVGLSAPPAHSPSPPGMSDVLNRLDALIDNMVEDRNGLDTIAVRVTGHSADTAPQSVGADGSASEKPSTASLIELLFQRLNTLRRIQQHNRVNITELQIYTNL